MNELSLFTGAGGGVLGSKLLGWRTIGYVEYEKYCQEIIKQRITDGILDAAPIFGDIRSFISEGYTYVYRGMVDVLTAGFPCQPFSVAGKQAGEDDPRNMWPATLRCIRLIRPRYALLENVPGLISSGYFGTVLGGLAEIGMDARWCVLGADDCGAPHRRKRLWILAYSRTRGCGEQDVCEKQQRGAEVVSAGPDRQANERPRGREDVAYTESLRGGSSTNGAKRERITASSEDVADSQQPGLEGLSGHGAEGNEPGRQRAKQDRSVGEGRVCWWQTDPADLPDTTVREQGEGRNAGGASRIVGGKSRPEEVDRYARGRGSEDGNGPTQPRLGRLAPRMADKLGFIEAAFGGKIPRVAVGVPNRVDRLKAIGNGQVPITMATAWRILSEENI